ncbi:MAG: tetratricopeptide repeat protein [Candidatus Aminicenantaceae bacterium]
MENKDLLDSWKEISNYLSRDIRTCYRWEKKFNLPVHRIDDNSPRSKVFAYKSEIDKWLKERSKNRNKIITNLYKKPVFIIGIIIIFSLIFLFLGYNLINKKRNLTLSEEYNSILVLPFKDSNNSYQDNYFSEGMTKEIIYNLSQLNTLKVIPISSISSYKVSDKSPEEIGKNLGANYVLYGNAEREEDNFILNVNLIKTKTKDRIWTNKYSTNLDDSFSVLKNICNQVNEAIFNKTIDQYENSYFPKAHPDNSKAYDNYLKGKYMSTQSSQNISEDPLKLYLNGKYYSRTLTQETNDMAISYFNEAINIDENFARAYIALAHCYLNNVNLGWDFDKRWINQAEKLIKKAHNITPDIPEYYRTYTKLLLIRKLGFNEDTLFKAINLGKEGIEKYPMNARIHSILGYCFYLKYAEEGNQNDFHKALKYKQDSFFLDERNFSNIHFSELLMLSKDFENALVVCNQIDNHSSFPRLQYRIGEIYYYMGNLKESRKTFQQINTPFLNKLSSLFYLGMVESQSGREQEALKIIQEVERLSPDPKKFYEQDLKLASIYMGLGKKEEGYKHLQSFFEHPLAKRQKYIYFRYIAIDKNFDSVRREERFKNILKNMEDKSWLAAKLLK